MFFCCWYLYMQLNEVLSPNPFNRPRAVIMLEVKGIEGSKFNIFCHFFPYPVRLILHMCLCYHAVLSLPADQQLLVDHLANAHVGSAIRSKVPVDSFIAEIQLPGSSMFCYVLIS